MWLKSILFQLCFTWINRCGHSNLPTTCKIQSRASSVTRFVLSVRALGRFENLEGQIEVIWRRRFCFYFFKIWGGCDCPSAPPPLIPTTLHVRPYFANNKVFRLQKNPLVIYLCIVAIRFFNSRFGFMLSHLILNAPNLLHNLIFVKPSHFR